MMGRELGEGYSFIKKKCFMCGSSSHLIKDCDYYEKKMAREAELKKQRVFNTGNGVAKPVWSNANKVNHANQFVPRSVQLNAGSPNINSVRPNINTGRTNVNSVRPRVNTGSSNVNNGRFKQHVPTSKSNSFSLVRPQGNWGTAVKTSAGYNWRNSRPNSNCDSGLTFIRTDHPLKNMEDRGIFDSGCSGHMTGNKDHLDDFEECKGGSVTFGGSKGYITGKGTLQSPNANASEEADEDEELIVVPTTIKHSVAKVRPRKSSTNSKEEKFLTELQNLQTQEKEKFKRICCSGIEEINAGSLDVNTGIDPVTTDSIRVSVPSPDRGRREGKAPMTEEEETQASRKTKEQILQEEAGLAEAIRLDALEKALEKEEVAKQVHLDSLIAQRMDEEQELTEEQKKRKAQESVLGKDLTVEDYAKRMVELVNQRRKHFAEERARAKRNKPMTQTQLRNYMSNFLKNQGTWKLTQLKKLNFEEVKAEFEKLVKQLDTYVPMNFEATKESLKRFSEELQTKTAKKLKFNDEARKGFHTDHDKGESEDSDEANEKDDSTSGTKIPINPVPVATKSPSIANYKIIKQGRKSVYQIVRENRTDMVYISFGAMLTGILRDDLTELYRIVIKKHGLNEPEDEFEKRTSCFGAFTGVEVQDILEDAGYEHPQEAYHEDNQRNLKFTSEDQVRGGLMETQEGIQLGRIVLFDTFHRNCVEIQAVEWERKAKNILLNGHSQEHMRDFMEWMMKIEYGKPFRTSYESHGAEVSTRMQILSYVISLPPVWVFEQKSKYSKNIFKCSNVAFVSRKAKENTNKVKSAFTGWTLYLTTHSTSSTNIPANKLLQGNNTSKGHMMERREGDCFSSTPRSWKQRRIRWLAKQWMMEELECYDGKRTRGCYSLFTKKKCFVCGSLSHLIKDCDYYEKKMAREAAPKKQRVFNTGNGVTKPVWNNVDKINHANHFVPRSVILNSGRPNVNSVRPNVNNVQTNINSVRQNVNFVWSNVNTGSFNVNSVDVTAVTYQEIGELLLRPQQVTRYQLEDFKEFNRGSVTFGGVPRPLLPAMLSIVDLSAGKEAPSVNQPQPSSTVLMTRIGDLEKQLKETKQTFGKAILTLVDRVETLEVALKRKTKRVLLSDFEEEETEAHGRKTHDLDPLVSLVQELTRVEEMERLVNDRKKKRLSFLEKTKNKFFKMKKGLAESYQIRML
ncbi:ribonuclease H-like domain-containing protein [Tanacetum coccineum]